MPSALRLSAVVRPVLGEGGKPMGVLMLKYGVAIPIFVTLRALADGSPHWAVSGCFGFTAYLLADLAVSNWMAKRA